MTVAPKNVVLFTIEGSARKGFTMASFINFSHWIVIAEEIGQAIICLTFLQCPSSFQERHFVNISTHLP